MTSSSDTEFTKRRIYVDGLPIKSSSAEVRALFSGKFHNFESNFQKFEWQNCETVS